MKKMLCAILLSAMLLSFCSCQMPSNNKSNVQNEGNDGRLTLIYSDGYVHIYVDNETGVQYLTVHYGGTCVIVDEKGDPLIYQKTMEDGEQE